jgi:hypothetical protein
METSSALLPVFGIKRRHKLAGIIALLCLCSGKANAHVVSPEDHHAFEHKYADFCVNKEMALRKKQNINTGNSGPDDALVKLCDCIAMEESKTLTKAEVKKFVREGKYPMSLMMKAGQAEAICSKK